MAAALILIGLTPFHFTLKHFFGVNLKLAVEVSDFLLLAAILYLGFRHRNWLIKAPALFQILALAYFEFFVVKDHVSSTTFFCDRLSLLMILIICLVGVLICFQAVPYMQNHEDHYLEEEIEAAPFCRNSVGKTPGIESTTAPVTTSERISEGIRERSIWQKPLFRSAPSIRFYPNRCI